MQITETNSDGLKRELKVVIEAKVLDEKLAKRLDELKGQVQLKGFRPGKVPLAHVKKVYGRSVMAEIVQQTVMEASQTALKDRDERPAFEPKISLTEDEKEIEEIMSGKADLAYTMSFEILPSIELSDLGKMKLEKNVADVDEDEIKDGMNRLADGGLTYESKDGVAEDGDQVTIDFVGRIDGEIFDGGSAEDANVVIGNNAFIPGFEEGLVGAKAGDERVLDTVFPEEYQAKELAGKAAAFTVTVKEVGAPKRPEIDEEFAKSMGMESLAKLKEAVQGRIEEEYEKASRAKLKRKLLDALDEAHKFELPPTLVEQEFDSVWRQVTERMAEADRSFEDEDTTEEKARGEYRKAAERRVRLGLVLSEIADKNEIKVTDDEVTKSLMAKAQQFPGQEKMVFEFYQKNPQALAELRAPLFEEKVVDFALELAAISEKKVSSEELFKFSDDEGDGEASAEKG